MDLRASKRRKTDAYPTKQQRCHLDFEIYEEDPEGSAVTHNESPLQRGFVSPHPPAGISSRRATPTRRGPVDADPNTEAWPIHDPNSHASPPQLLCNDAYSPIQFSDWRTS
ncbi:uncharacterized protein BCR38DRAFT_480592 [Pseudomassariella vexata]|uniref:Uncharacterized protein n=1 Tax=Pseudomassariella vexata TaxID=1141098 RepID=A0A1Y2EKP9_9PEZI|nr:uncharacterized protein BCR38DRAFT_480592 [Pseudomassariella vexata]ORY72130.1 hypothetical protein BCR38DRAFT_480592 [Pseudomassariella vexata]